MIRGQVIDVPKEVVDELSAEWLDAEGRIKLMPAAEFRRVPHDHLQAWCHYQARYGIPTIELIDWLKEKINGRGRAVEVGAGNGDLGFHLGIPSTDSCLQRKPEMQFMYRMMGQIPTNPPADVIPYDAETAVKKLKPQVVVASWLTRKFIKGQDIDGQAQASVYGPEERNILKGCRLYIHIGNDNIHGEKTILKYPHQKYYFDWIVSKASDQSKNVIYVWEGR